MIVFKRGLDLDFMRKLEILARRPGWFADVLADPDLVLVDQVTRYRDKLQERRDDVLESYHLVASNLVEIAKWSDGHRKLGGLVEEVAEKKRPIVLDETPFVGLIIFEFDEAQKDSPRWSKLAAKLPLIARGDPKGMKLRGTRPLSSSPVGA